MTKTLVEAGLSSQGGQGAGAVEIRYDYEGQGLKGLAVDRFDLSSGIFVHSLAAGLVREVEGFDGRLAWNSDVSGAVVSQPSGLAFRLAVNAAYRRAGMWYRPDRGGARVTPLARRIENGATYDVLQVLPKGGDRFEAWFDRSTHQLYRIVEAMPYRTAMTTTYGDYRRVSGVIIPGKMTMDDGSGAEYAQVYTLRSGRTVKRRGAAAYAAPRTSYVDAGFPPHQGSTTFPIRMVRNCIYGDVSVNGRGPFTFLFDGGGADIVDPTLMEQLKLPIVGSVPGHGPGAGVVKTGYGSGINLGIGGLSLRRQTVHVLDVTEPSLEVVRPVGVIGNEVSRRFVTRIDYGAEIMSLIAPERFDPRSAGTPVPFEFYGHIPLVRGTFEGHPARFAIDTGSCQELTLMKRFVDAKGLIESHPVRVNTTGGGSGVGGAIALSVVDGRAMTLGKIEVKHVVTELSRSVKGGFGVADFEGNVGSRLLKRFVVTFDYARRVMYLKPAVGRISDIGTYDRSGMTIRRAPEGFVVAGLVPGGPATMAGIQVGEYVTAVDGAAASAIPTLELRERLRNSPTESKVTFSLKNASGTRNVTIVLKDLI
ncbi:PDZ domain-containing protein [Sphingomonas sp. LB3N6]|uniref:PDZ domain-containing protein n=1 Tax=Sphingomonas fucosidasi TaxID=3096164 RepID=UPI002FC740DB